MVERLICSTGATATAVGTGDSNTRLAVTAQGAGSYAAYTCYNLTLNGYSDWFLPSKDELYQLWTNRAAIGEFASQWYWSSSETNASTAWTKIFTTSTSQSQYDKSVSYYVRAVREIIGLGYQYGGGKVAYLFQPGDPGYVAGELHGLIISAANVGSTVYWGCGSTTISGADGTAIGTGNQNTTDIINGCAETNIAAELCYNLTLNGYTDWYLPSRDEMYKIWLNRSYLGSFSTGYWTSTESSTQYATSIGWSTGLFAISYKDFESFYVRAIRTF